MVAGKFLLGALGLAATAVAQLPQIEIYGQKMFYSNNGSQFFIKGVAYQQDVGANGASDESSVLVDPLADPTACARDIPYLQNLNTNTIRVYAIDPSMDHSECINAFANAGIYIFSDLSSPNVSIDQDSPSWNVNLYDRYTSVIDALANYTNVIGFFAGNEVSDNSTNADAMAFVKASIRDSKAYVKSKGYSKYIGYAADDGAEIRWPVEDYINCGDQADAIDFFGYNIYSWCGSGSSFATSQYQLETEVFTNYSVPAFFAEYGCNNPEPRYFDDTPVIYSSKMTGVWSGAIVFEYFQATNDFGLVTVDSNSQVSTLTDYNTFSSQIAKASPTGVSSSAYTPSNSPRACPTPDSTFNVASSPLPPAPNAAICACMVASLTCVAKSSVNILAYGDLFSAACSSGSCAGITANGTSGTYGPFSMCNPADQLSWAFNQYYLNQLSTNSQNYNACNFQGNATSVSPSPASTCSAMLASVGGVTGTAAYTGAAATGSGVYETVSGTVASGTGNGKSAATTSVTIPGAFQVTFWVVGAMLAGVGCLLL